MTNLFIENNKERVLELSKRSGKERENYLIDLINELTLEIHQYKSKIAKIHTDLEDDFFNL